MKVMKDLITSTSLLNEDVAVEKTSDESRSIIKQLSQQIKVYEKRMEELEKANNELAVYHQEKDNCMFELSNANKELATRHDEKEKCVEELNIANKNLAYQMEKKELQITSLEEMLVMISNMVMQPVGQIMELIELMEKVIDSPEKLMVKIGCIKRSALALDTFTKELSTFVERLLTPNVAKIPKLRKDENLSSNLI